MTSNLIPIVTYIICLMSVAVAGNFAWALMRNPKKWKGEILINAFGIAITLFVSIYYIATHT